MTTPRRGRRSGSESEKPVEQKCRVTSSGSASSANSPIIGGLAGFRLFCHSSSPGYHERHQKHSTSSCDAPVTDCSKMSQEQVEGGKGSLEITRVPTSTGSASTARKPDPSDVSEATPGPESVQAPISPPTTTNIAEVNATPGHHLLNGGGGDGGDDDDPAVIPNTVPRSLALRLYVSHFLSTWNSRVFEFGAALFLTSIFPGTLLPVSIYSLVRNAGYIIFAQPVGNWINRGNRLSLIRASIIGQRVPVAASCALLLVLLLKGDELGSSKNTGVFAVVVFLSVVEKLSATMNLISVERDWVSGASECRGVCRSRTYVS